MPGPPKGKPYKMSKETVEKILEVLRAGNTRTCAAECAGISYDTFKKWFDADVIFGDAVKKAEAECEARNVTLIQKAAATTWQAAAWWLERSRRTMYGRTITIDLSGLTDEQLRTLASGTDPQSSDSRGEEARPLRAGG